MTSLISTFLMFKNIYLYNFNGNIQYNSELYHFNKIQNHDIQCNSKSYYSIEFKITLFNTIQNYIIQYNSK